MSKIILLHGWSMNGDVFAGQKGSFPGHQVHAPDLHGTDHGQIENILLSAGKDKTVLAGWSMGVSMILAELESIQPQVSGLVFISGSPCFMAREDFPQGMRQSIARRLYQDFQKDFHQTWRTFTGLLTHAEKIDDKVLSELKIFFEKTWKKILPEQAMSDLNWLYQGDYRDKLKEIKVPLMIISGSEDRICFPDASRYIKEQVAGSSLHIIDGAGHMPFFTRAEEVNSLIRDFVNGH